MLFCTRMDNARYCGQCGTPASAEDDRFCRSCGKPFLVQSEPSVKRESRLSRMVNLAIVLIVGTLVVAAFGRMLENSTTPGAPSSTSRLSTINTAVPCAESETDEAEAIRSVLHNDMAAYVGLSTRKHIPQIESGTAVDVIYTDGGLTQVRVSNGFNAGLSCWVPAKAIE